jgi:hypothetical protein
MSPEFPIVISRVPRELTDSYHNVLRRTFRPTHGDASSTVDRSDYMGPQLYPERASVGKSTTQIRWNDGNKKLVTSDAESYDKWSQALNSAADLLAASTRKPLTDPNPVFTFVMPVLVVSNGSLWAVDYTEDGTRGSPASVDETTLFVDREILFDGVYVKHSLRMSHLHIYTRIGFVNMLQSMAVPSSLMLERIFGPSLRNSSKQPP